MQTVSDYISSARTLMQDTTSAPRYSDEQFKLALDMAFDEAFRLRPDIFLQLDVPTFAGAATSTVVPVPRGYQSAFLFYAIGFVQLQDQEETTDKRATAMLAMFTSKLLVTAS